MIRSKELFDSGMNYNISNENITIIDHTDLQDGIIIIVIIVIIVIIIIIIIRIIIYHFR
jgi:hypothetical protein